MEATTIKVVVPTAVWSFEAHLLASAIEQLHALRVQMVRLWVDERKLTPTQKKQLKPLIIDRPGLPSKYERRGTTLGELKAMMMAGEV